MTIEHCGKHTAINLFPSLQKQCFHMSFPPKVYFISEVYTYDFTSILLFLPFEIIVPYKRAWHTMTNNINTEKISILLPKISF